MITLTGEIEDEKLALSENFLFAFENMRETRSFPRRLMLNKLVTTHSFRCPKLTLLVDPYDWQVTFCRLQFIFQYFQSNSAQKTSIRVN